MRHAKALMKSLKDHASGRLEIPPADIMIMGYTKPPYEPLVLEALANHPGVGKLWYVPMDGPVGGSNFAICSNDVKRFFADAKDDEVASKLGEFEKMRLYTEGYAPNAVLFTFDIKPLLQRHGGPPLSDTMIRKKLDAHFDTLEFDFVAPTQPDILINGSNNIGFTGFVTRRNTIVTDNDPVHATGLNMKIYIPMIGDAIEKHHGLKVTTDCASVHTLPQLRKFMDRIDADQIALKLNQGMAGVGVFRVFRETRDGPLMAECTNTRVHDEGKKTRYKAEADGQPRVFSLTDYFFRKEGSMLAMRWLDNSRGDIRVVLQDGCAVGAYKRMSVDGNWLCNYSQGGTIHPVDMKRDLSLHDRQKIKAIAEMLKNSGVTRASIDLLADEKGERFLSEVNIGFTDDIVELHTHDMGKQAAFGRLSIPDQIAADIVASYTDIAAERLLRYRERNQVVNG